MAKVMQGYMAMLAKYAAGSPNNLGYDFYDWALEKYGIPDDGEPINFDTYAMEYIQEVAQRESV